MFIKVFLKNDEYDLHAKKEKVFVVTKRANKTIKSLVNSFMFLFVNASIILD